LAIGLPPVEVIMTEKLPFQLAMTDPGYRYPRSRNPYWQKLMDLHAESLFPLTYTDNQTEQHAGAWRTRFPDQKEPSPSRKLHVELGCNAGHVTVEWAKADPEGAYIGLDWKYKPIFRAAQKSMAYNQHNALWFRAHAERLHFMFAKGEIDFLYLFFPDPWAKKSQWKNRFITSDTLRTIAPVLHPTGIFHIKTDHRGYFDWMREAVADSPFTILEQNEHLHLRHPAPHTLQFPEVTLFEKVFIKQGLPIHSMKLGLR